jgi:hypothetical protein
VFAVLLLGYIWGWRTSGFLECTASWFNYPWGYRYDFFSPQLGHWPLNRESEYYLIGHMAFLQTPGVFLTYGNGYELHRLLYSVLSRGFWPFEPLVAFWLFDICLWYLAVVAAVYTAATFCRESFCQWATACLMLSGQGFLHAVGEIMPHLIGYASGFYILAFCCYQRIWQRDCPWQEEALVYILIGILQLAYGTAWFSLPLVMGLSLIKRYPLITDAWLATIREIMGLGGLAVLPGLFLMSAAKLIVKNAGITEFLWDITAQQFHFVSWVKSFLWVMLDSFLALGPFMVTTFLVMTVIALFRGQYIFRFAVIVFLIQLCLVSLLLVRLAGRGYTTFAITPLLMIGAGWLLTYFFWVKRPQLRGVAFGVLVGSFVFAHLFKLGYRLPGLGFYTGYFKHLQSGHWQKYDLYLIP